jgi:hypothetical protein
MTCTTSRRSLPAANLRTGPWAAALPKDEGLDRLLADPALGSTCKAIALALVRHWAWRKDHCWPSDATIAAKVGRSAGHVQRSLRALERAGWVRRERTNENRTGRVIVLLWRRQPDDGARPDTTTARGVPPATARDKKIVSSTTRTEGQGKSLATTMTTGFAPSPRANAGAILKPEAVESPTPARPVPQKTPQPILRPARCGWLGRQDLAGVAAATNDPILLGEVLRLSAPPAPPEPSPWGLPASELVPRLAGRHDLVMPSARALCVAVQDEKAATLRACHAMARAVAAREVPADFLSACLKQATGPQARHRGKVLVAAWKRR